MGPMSCKQIDVKCSTLKCQHYTSYFAHENRKTRVSYSVASKACDKWPGTCYSVPLAPPPPTPLPNPTRFPKKITLSFAHSFQLTGTTSNWRAQLLTDRHNFKLTCTTSNWRAQLLTACTTSNWRAKLLTACTTSNWRARLLTDGHNFKLTCTTSNWRAQLLTACTTSNWRAQLLTDGQCDRKKQQNLRVG